MSSDDELEEFKLRYAERLESELGHPTGGDDPDDDSSTSTRDYDTFRKTYLPKHFSWYEKACNASEKLLKTKPDAKNAPKLQEAIDTCQLGITPTGATSFAYLVPIIIVLLFLTFGWLVPFALAEEGESVSAFFVVFGLLAAVSVMIPLQKMVFFMANSWRMKASNQMVLCVFYIVTYMRHTSNLELAIDFAAEHLGPPLSLDLKKIIWNIETQKYDSVKESLDHYLNSWRQYNMEFIESMHLIESSLYESSESRRVDALDKSLRVMLDETYEKMLHYAHNLKGPLTTLHMLGIILPILGLVILPMVVSFMPEVKWYHLFMLYNVALPIGVYYLGKDILASRPTGYGQRDIAEDNPQLKKFRNVIVKVGSKSEVQLNPASFAIIIFAAFFLVGAAPLIMWEAFGSQDYGAENDIAVMKDFSIERGRQTGDQACNVMFYFLDYREETKTNDQGDRENTGRKIGPYGLGSSLLSLGIPLAFGLGLGAFYRLRSKNVIKLRKRAKELEAEFASALFQLGNRLGDGYPAEIAFQRVAEVMEGTVSGKFFELVSINIQKQGMGVEKAIFDPHNGALLYYPSNLIESSMKVLIESSKKGPLIASQALINVSEYIKQMHRVDERLIDLMADVISSMVSQIRFLTPAIAGIVIGITSMITQILGTLGERMESLASGGSAAEMGAGMQLLNMFGNGVPTFYFQIIVGLYVVQITFILTVLVNGIQNGADKLSERYLLGNNLTNSTLTYVTLSFIVMLLFAIIAGSIVNNVEC